MSHNNITGDRIATRPSTDKFREGWDGVFKPEPEPVKDDPAPVVQDKDEGEL